MSVSGLVLVALFLLGQYAPVTKYDPKRDAAKDIDDAVVEAQRSGRRVLLEIGGEWCSWCHTMDRFFAEHDDLRAMRDRAFITLKVNMSPENENKAFLSKYPPIPGYPHIFILEGDGTLLHSEDTSLLEQGSTYNLATFMTFLREWSKAS